MAADALDLGVPRSSTAMVLTMYDKEILFFHMEGFPLHTPSRSRDLEAKHILMAYCIGDTTVLC